MRPYKTVVVYKLFHGFASVRSYKVDEAKQNRQGLIIIWKNKKTDEIIASMTVKNKDLDKGLPNGYKIQSKQKEGQTYDLIDFDFRADKIPFQLSLI